MKIQRALLWDIAEYPIYLLGTLHVGPVGGFRFPRFADAIIGSQESAYFELDPFASRDMSAMLRTAEHHGSLAQEVGEVLYHHLVQQQLPLANPLDAHLAGALADIIEVRAAGIGTPKFSFDWSVDSAVCARFHSQGKSVDFLETDDLQVQALVTGPMSEIVAELEYWRMNGRIPRGVDDRLVTAYAKGDLAELAELRKNIAPMRPTRMRAMLQDRERQWVAKLEEIKASGRSTLIAVGALHFPGEDGFLAQLSRAGYSVRFLGNL